MNYPWGQIILRGELSGGELSGDELSRGKLSRDELSCNPYPSMPGGVTILVALCYCHRNQDKLWPDELLSAQATAQQMYLKIW
jgi:hypothetical protein